jgi:hypothetical protein
MALLRAKLFELELEKQRRWAGRPPCGPCVALPCKPVPQAPALHSRTPGSKRTSVALGLFTQTLCFALSAHAPPPPPAHPPPPTHPPPHVQRDFRTA